MRVSVFARPRWLPAVVVLAAACAESTGPGDVFDPAITSESASQVGTALENSQAVRSLSVLGGDLILSAPPAPAAAVGDPALGALSSAVFNAAALAPIFPADKLGKTLVCTFSTPESRCRYQVDPQRTGAPANGVRFILYAVDPVIKKVVTPLQEIGYLDVTDKSTPAAATVGIKAVVNGTTLLEYDASAVVTTTSITFSAKGYVTDGTTRLDFDLSQTLSQGAASIDYQVSVAGKDRSIRFVASGSREEPMGTVTLTIKDRGHTTELKGTGNDDAISGTISYDGKVVINISGTPDHPVFTPADGATVTEEQLRSLKRLFNFVEELFDHFDHLLKPAHRTLSINW